MVLNAQPMQPFTSVQSVWQAMRRTRKGDWRLVDAKYGAFTKSNTHWRGMQIATDGCVMIARMECGKWIEGHITNWVVEATKSDMQRLPISSKAAKAAKGIVNFVRVVN